MGEGVVAAVGASVTTSLFGCLQWQGKELEESHINDDRFYARAWLSHRGALARVTWGDPQCHAEVCVPFEGGSKMAKGRAMAKVKALLLGVIISLQLHR